jgi:hypothetical protein
MSTPDLRSVFERIYATDLVYVPECWKLCGDAHCCSFARYKSRFRAIARTPFQELPLLPGEYEFLASQGWLQQFGDHDHKVIDFSIEGYTLTAESIVSRKPNCACDHDTRTTICRLYPFLPVLDIDGNLVSTESLGIYEEMERIAGLAPACQVSTLPVDEAEKFSTIVGELGRTPIHVYYLEAYRITKRHVSQRLASRSSAGDVDVFTAFEGGFMRQNLIDTDSLRSELSHLARRFERHHADSFQL